MGNEILDHISKLKEKALCFHESIWLLDKEESGTNQAEIIEAWKLIIRKLLNEIHSLLISLKEEIAWSLLDEHKSDFLQTGLQIEPGLNYYREFEDENTRKMMIEIQQLFDEGKNGFRQSFIGDDYYEKIFNKELEKYAAENKAHLEVLYSQDSEDNILIYPDENERKNYMVKMRREQLFETRFGKIYHENERKIKLTVYYIIELKEQDYKDINEFLGKYLAYQIAKEHCEIKNETVFKQHVFKENVDVDKVMKKLDEFIKDKTIGAQKHWFIVYKIFFTKKWLKKNTQAAFIDCMNSVFQPILKCSSGDFKKIEGYFKETDYAEWSLEDPKAPSCCETYKMIADKLDQEFVETKYAKPGKLINAKKHVSFR